MVTGCHLGSLVTVPGNVIEQVRILSPHWNNCLVIPLRPVCEMQPKPSFCICPRKPDEVRYPGCLDSEETAHLLEECKQCM